MNIHEEDIHKKVKNQCDLCEQYFSKHEKLKDHKTSKHNVGIFPCNECHYKASNLTLLDEHIVQCHRPSNNDKDIDIRDVSKKKSCDPSHPKHTSKCCDRRPPRNEYN